MQIFSFQPKQEQRARFEDIVLAYYPRLLQWALQLTHDRSEAEDLVQELYLRVARIDAAPETIENIDSYLFFVLRNLHYENLRRARTSAIDDLAIVDHESLARGLRAVDHSKLPFVRAELEHVCDYLCDRKITSRSASILLLRFFLGYFPGEVMKVAQMSRTAVDKAVRLARQEVRLDLAANTGPRRTERDRERRVGARDSKGDPQALFLALRAQVFDGCSGQCFARGFLQRQYANPGPGFTTEELAHLVSCRNCLDKANAILGLPLLAERFLDETIGRDTPQGPDGDSGGSGMPTLIRGWGKRPKENVAQIRRRMERRVLEAMQHRPQRLLVVVDGDIRASQRVTAPLSELQVELGRHEKPTYIEILSEQNICIAFLMVRTPDLSQELDQLREIQLSDDRTIELLISFAMETPTIQVIYRDPLVSLDGALEEPGEMAIPVTLSASSMNATPSRPAADGYASLRHWVRSWFPRISPPKMSPLFASAMVLGFASILCFVFWMRSGPNVSAKELLTRAEAWDASAASTSKPGVIYQRIRISTPNRSVERTIYRDPAGKRKPRQHELDNIDQQLKMRLESAGVSWDAPLSASSFQAWHDRQRSVRDTVTRSENLLTLTSFASDSGPIMQETLTVRESDFHPVRRSIDMRGVGNIEIAELNYDVMPWGALDGDWFEPSVAPLVNPHRGPGVLSHPLIPLSEDELDEADLGVRLALNQLGADTGERVTMVRTPTGIQVKGIVATEDRKREIEARLFLIPHVTPLIFTFNEIQSRPEEGDSIASIASVSDAAQASPFENYLVEHGKSREYARQSSADLLDSAISIKQSSLAIMKLLHDFSDGRPMTPAAQMLHKQLVELHRGKLHAAISRQESLLAAMGLSHAASGTPSPPDGDLEAVANRNLALCKLLSRQDGGSKESAQPLLEELADSAAKINIVVQRMDVNSSSSHASLDAGRSTQPDQHR
ncbi:MAG TPA: RNA polymerase sigma factor [Acidisarcina sp.]|nr:RNA polymerase sigma factor [Acidisarcina sp.]